MGETLSFFLSDQSHTLRLSVIFFSPAKLNEQSVSTRIPYSQFQQLMIRKGVIFSFTKNQ